MILRSTIAADISREGTSQTRSSAQHTLLISQERARLKHDTPLNTRCWHPKRGHVSNTILRSKHAADIPREGTSQTRFSAQHTLLTSQERARLKHDSPLNTRCWHPKRGQVSNMRLRSNGANPQREFRSTNFFIHSTKYFRYWCSGDSNHPKNKMRSLDTSVATPAQIFVDK
jgi:hypothetical protein